MPGRTEGADWLVRHVPAAGWLRHYRRSDLSGDLSAGLTVAVMLIPQGMAYAMLAGLPPIVGLYASIAPLVVYALLGTSRQLAVGPVAMVSLMTATGVGAIAQGGTEQYLALSVLLAGMVGAVQLAMGLFRLGFLVNFLSHPVVSGFTSAAALIIGFSQLKHLLGVNLARSHHVHAILIEAIRRAGEINFATLAVGATGIVLLVGLRAWRKGFPSALVVVVLSTLATWVVGLDGRGVAIVAEVPSGLPAPRLPVVDLDSVRALLPTALAISFVGFMESISVAKAFAARNRYAVDASQELVALGAANLAGTVFGAYPVTGGFSRTAVNAQAGARTGLATLVTAAVIAVTLLFLTPLFHYLPKAVLASIVMVAVAGLVDWREPLALWRVKRADSVLLVLTFVATLSLGIELGILVGVAGSLLAFLRRTTAPHTAIEGRLPDSVLYRNVLRHPDAQTCDRVAVLRIDSSLYFANIAFLRDRVNELVVEGGPNLEAVVIDARPINDVDASAAHGLLTLADDLEAGGVALALAAVKGPVRDVLERAGVVAHLGRRRFFPDVHSAVAEWNPACGPHEATGAIAS